MLKPYTYVCAYVLDTFIETNCQDNQCGCQNGQYGKYCYQKYKDGHQDAHHTLDSPNLTSYLNFHKLDSQKCLFLHSSA